MNLLDIFKRNSTRKAQALSPTWTHDGICYVFNESLESLDLDSLLAHFDDSDAEATILGAYLSQLIVEDVATIQHDRLTLSWKNVYRLQSDPAHQNLFALLRVPEIRVIQPIVGHESTLSDPEFEVRIEGWSEKGTQIAVKPVCGAVVSISGQEFLLPESTWHLVEETKRFSARLAEDRTQHENELGWGRIRNLAEKSGAFYTSPYLETTIVLTPETLRLPLDKAESTFGRVLTVSPTFEGAPDGWLRAFDEYQTVQPHYNLTNGGRGRVKVVISEPVRHVLDVIKREMPGRRIAGAKAEKFIHNPWAFLGDAARDVIKEDDFEADKADVGPLSAEFSVVPRLSEGRVERVDLVVTEFSGEMASTDTRPFSSPLTLGAFISKLQQALTDEREWFPWDEYDLTLDGVSAIQLEQAQQLLWLWKNQPDERISLDDIYELTAYSDRIEGIGVAKALYVPIFQKPAGPDEGEKGWLPTDLSPMVRVTLQGHEGQVVIPLTHEWVEQFAARVQEAELQGLSEVCDNALPTAIETGQARALADSFNAMLGAEDRVSTDKPSQSKEVRPKRETLLVKTNFHGVDYLEERRASLELAADAAPELPSTLRAAVKLKNHQLFGVAWFQHLVSRTPYACRGALLADDMGLGKTLQLLALLGWYYEKSPDAAPSVVLVPKSLMDNWVGEAKKFFTPSYPEVLALYGSDLASRKQPLHLIDDELHTKGVTDLLRPGWVGTAKLIVTTYEVLTSYEFSFAKQPFSFVICDEAQRIKTPGTLVTLAAKKLKAHFRIACTGTPVENSLADLWCLFDFVQPGLLGALEDFGKTYRRPIECDTEEQKGALAQLKALIGPQILRRTKADIADELKRKFFAYGCPSTEELQFKERLGVADRLEISLSDHQKILYKGGLKKLQDASKEGDGRKRAQLSFGALHLMKAVCAEPYCLPSTKFLLDSRGMAAHLANSPKLSWFLDHLEAVQERNEKAIVFTEIREVQAALYHFLRERFGLKPLIINGDSQGRQRYIDQFSAKEGFDVIILSTLAAGAGLNVTAANHVFHFTRAWNPSKENQATDRAYRIGQEKDVYVYCPTMVSDDFVSFEVRLDELLKRKAGLADATMDGDGMEAMLNGTGKDASFSELVGEGRDGPDVPARNLGMDDVDRMDGFAFEVFTAMLWDKKGYQSLITPKKGGDGGIDVVAFSGKNGQLIQCKSSIREDVGWDAVKEVVAGAAKYRARYAGTKFSNVAMTNQRFTRSAVSQAEANRVSLVERPQLDAMLKEHPVSDHEFNAALIYWLPVYNQAAA